MRRGKESTPGEGTSGDRESFGIRGEPPYSGYASQAPSPNPVDVMGYSSGTNRGYNISNNYSGGMSRHTPSPNSPAPKSMYQQERSPSASRNRPQMTNENLDYNRARPMTTTSSTNSRPRGAESPYQTPSTNFVGQPQVHPHYSQPSAMGATSVPSRDAMMNNYYYQQQPPPPQQQQPQPLQTYPAKPSATSVSITPTTMQSDPYSLYTPQVSISQSQSSSSHRRPAYLLHRDLVIGKGSYGQVCIASRGEAEGYHTGVRGKRKKYACKCVVLRNDAKYIAKLQEEVNVLREVRGHENIIRLYDVFCVDNELFIITELGRGGDLFHLLTTHPKHGVTESYAGMCFVDEFLYSMPSSLVAENASFFVHVQQPRR